MRSIYEPIQENLIRVESSLKQMANLRFPFLAKLLEQALDTEGKRIRPALTLLASEFHPHDGVASQAMATAVELLHIATLIHDDTVDASHIRRGKATISSLWGRNVAVLAGDYIFATSAVFVCDTNNIRVIRRFSETIMQLSSGELQELAETYNSNLSRESYLEQINNKTASLFTTAGESGAILSGAPEETVNALKEYSYNLGMAFQIVDDVLDFDGAEEEVGKPVGNDLSNGIVTLPAILAMEQYPKDNPVFRLLQDPQDQSYLNQAVDLIQNSSMLEESLVIAKQFSEKALSALTSLPNNPSRNSLEAFVRYVLERRK